MIFCHKLKSKQPKLSSPPFLDEIGEKIYNEISEPAWDMWLMKQTQIINHYQLDPMDEKAQDLLDGEMMTFLFD